MNARRPLRANAKSPDVRRLELLAAAAALFEERGVGAVTVADIAERAGLAKGSFYLFFDSKERLLNAMRVGFSESAAARIDELRLPVDGDWDAFTDRLVRTAIAFQVEQYQLHEIVRMPHQHGAEPAWGEGDPIARAMRRVIEAGVAAGQYLVDDADTVTGLVLDLLHLSGDRACRQPDQQEAIAASTSALVRRALLRPRPS